MRSRTPWFSVWFPALLFAPLSAQRVNPVDRHLVAAGLWSEARYNYAYWNAVRANWDSAFAATVPMIDTRGGPGGPGRGTPLTDLQVFPPLRRRGAPFPDR